MSHGGHASYVTRRWNLVQVKHIVFLIPRVHIFFKHELSFGAVGDLRGYGHLKLLFPGTGDGYNLCTCCEAMMSFVCSVCSVC